MLISARILAGFQATRLTGAGALLATRDAIASMAMTHASFRLAIVPRVGLATACPFSDCFGPCFGRKDGDDVPLGVGELDSPSDNPDCMHPMHPHVFAWVRTNYAVDHGHSSRDLIVS